MIKKLPLNIIASQDVINQTSSSDFKIGVRADAESDSIDLMIHGVIGASWDALDSASVGVFLKQHKGKKINADINSGGGLAYDGVSIYNALIQHDAPVNVTITGIAASAATIIAMAGDTIKIAANASFMIHRAMSISVGNYKAMQDTAEFLQKLDDQIAATYAARTGRKAATMLKFMDGSVDGTTFNAAETVANGFASEVIPLKQKTTDSTHNEAESVVMATASASELAGQFTAEAQQRHANIVAARMAQLKLDETE